MCVFELQPSLWFQSGFGPFGGLLAGGYRFLRSSPVPCVLRAVDRLTAIQNGMWHRVRVSVCSNTLVAYHRSELTDSSKCFKNFIFSRNLTKEREMEESDSYDPTQSSLEWPDYVVIGKL